MATVTTYVKKDGVALPGVAGGSKYWEVRIDFSATGRSAADIIQLFEVPAETMVEWINYEVETIEDSTATIDIGDGDSTTRFFTNGNAESLGYATTNDTKHIYTASDTIDMTLDHDMDTAIIRVCMKTHSVAPRL